MHDRRMTLELRAAVGLDELPVGIEIQRQSLSCKGMCTENDDQKTNSGNEGGEASHEQTSTEW